VTLSSTPIVLAYFAEKDKGTREELTKVVYNVTRKLEKTNIRIDAEFRGIRSHSSSMKRDLMSETVDGEIFYWLSNRFLKECDAKDDELCLEVNSSKKNRLNQYKIENLKGTLGTIDNLTDADKDVFVNAVNDSIKSGMDE